MKKLVSVLVSISLLLFGFGGLLVSASAEKPKVHNSLQSFQQDTAEFVHDEIVVKFKNDDKPFIVIKVTKGEVKEKVKEYSNRSDVVYAEPNYYAHASFVPNDPIYNSQWNLHNQASGGIEMEKAWDIETGSANVIVAIVDTGIAYENYQNYLVAPDLANTSFVQGYDFINNDIHANDDHSHGTHVAGTVAQSTNNSIGVAGVAYNITLMPVKVLDGNGYGTTATVANGIMWAADNGADVINLSLGQSVSSQTLLNAVQYAYDKGVTLVAAAGNNGLSSIVYPAAYDQYVIAVGATNANKNLAPYSSYGTSLDLVAPGGDLTMGNYGGIIQNTFNPNTKDPTDFGYWAFQGTSMATPHVTGVAALLIANGNATTPDTIRSALQETALDLGASGRDDIFGWGLINAYAALRWPNAAPTANSQQVSTPEDTANSIQLTATDPNNDQLTYQVVSNPAHGTLSGTAPNIIYTPNANYNGLDSFTFKANDGLANSNTATVSITITPVNDPPVANSQQVRTPINTPLGIILTATDVDNAQLAYSIVSGPTHGTLSGTAPNLIYTPNANYNGSDSFTFKANDGLADSNTATVSINFTSANDPPVANDQTVSIKKNTSAEINLTAADVNNDPLTYVIVDYPGHGVLSGTAPNLRYTPDKGYEGSDSFTFKVNDRTVDSNIATVSIIVTRRK